MEQEKNQVEEMPKKKWRHILIEYFMEIIQAEQNLDSLRQSLNQQNNFSVQNIFNNLDNDNKGYLTLGDFIKFLSSHSIEFEEKNIRQLIRFYDKNNDFVLNYEEFKPMICNIEYNEEKNENNNKELDENILSIFCDILLQEIDLCKICSENVKKCLESRHFTIYEAFVEIADDEGYVTEEILQKFLDENGIKVDIKNIKKIIYRLDSDNDGKVSFVEFNNVFFPPCYNIDKNYNEYRYKLNDFNIKINNDNNNNSIINNKSNEKPDKNRLKNTIINIDNYNDNSEYNKILDFKYGFSSNPKLKYTSKVLNYNYSKYPDTDVEKYKLNKEYYSIKNSKGINDSDNLCTSKHIFIHCHCCNCCCNLCCN